jgi:glutathione reductase (NADPH)
MRTTAMSQENEVDVIVVASGSAGATVARACAQAGRRVAIIDSRPFGGTCAQRGCDAKRVLIGAAELDDWSGRFSKRGLARGKLTIAWPELMRFKRTFTETIPADREYGLRELGITMFHDRAHFVGRS